MDFLKVFKQSCYRLFFIEKKLESFSEKIKTSLVLLADKQDLVATGRFCQLEMYKIKYWFEQQSHF